MSDGRIHCPECGYDLRGQIALRCPECGFHYDLPALKIFTRSRICEAVRPQFDAVPLLLASLCLAATGAAGEFLNRWLLGTALVFLFPLLRRGILSWTVTGSFPPAGQRAWIIADMLSLGWLCWLLCSVLIGMVVALLWLSIATCLTIGGSLAFFGAFLTAKGIAHCQRETVADESAAQLPAPPGLIGRTQRGALLLTAANVIGWLALLAFLDG